jgi:hypothetical protein
MLPNGAAGRLFRNGRSEWKQFHIAQCWQTEWTDIGQWSGPGVNELLEAGVPSTRISAQTPFCVPSPDCSFFLARDVRLLARLRLPNSSVSLSLSLRRGAVGSNPKTSKMCAAGARASELECIIPNPGSAGVSRSGSSVGSCARVTGRLACRWAFGSCCRPRREWVPGRRRLGVRGRIPASEASEAARSLACRADAWADRLMDDLNWEVSASRLLHCAGHRPERQRCTMADRCLRPLVVRDGMYATDLRRRWRCDRR